MNNYFRTLFFILLFVGVAACQSSEPDTALDPTQMPIVNQSFKSSGRLQTASGKTFPYRYAAADAPGITAIYFAGAGGDGNLVAPISKKFTAAGISLITFDRTEPSCNSTQQCVANVLKRSKSGFLLWKDENGNSSATDDILANEALTILEFAKSTPTYNPEKGIVLLGGSYGSFIVLSAVNAFPNDPIKGLVFVSPGVLEQWLAMPGATQFQANQFDQLVSNFGGKPALAIGGKRDIIAPFLPEVARVSAYDAAVYLQSRVGGELIEVGSAAHSAKLLTSSPETVQKIIDWINAQFS